MKRSRPCRPEEAASIVQLVASCLGLVIGAAVYLSLGVFALRSLNRGKLIPSVVCLVVMGSVMLLFRRIIARARAIDPPGTTLPEERPGQVFWSPVGVRVRRIYTWRRRAYLKAERDQREVVALARAPSQQALTPYESVEEALNVPDHFIEAAFTSRIQWVGRGRFEAVVRCLAPALPAALRITSSSVEIAPPAAVEGIAGLRCEVDRLMRALPSATIGTTRSGVVISVPRGLDRPEDLIGLGGLASDLCTVLGAIGDGYRGGRRKHEEITGIERAMEREVAETFNTHDTARNTSRYSRP